MVSPQRFYHSLRHAVRGFVRAFQAEHSFRIHTIAAIAVLIVIFVLDLDLVARAVVVLVVGIVLMLELLNTAIERLVGMMEPRVHPAVATIKDLMAASVLAVTVAAVIIAFLTIFPALRN